ncbi:MAG: Holliday junction branch migration protein RuvA [Verrucomicrobiales bacterium]|nr:Holliday junction branch migration protein RuvA [Verrucomicrobiales bacterium]
MITFLQGKLTESWPGRLVIDVNGVGYEVLVPLLADGSFGQIGETVFVRTHHHIREQEQTLYGFPDDDGRDLFRLLIGRVSGVGPKVGMSVMSGMSAADFKAAVVAGDITAISKIKGLGKKTAERIVLELKDKVGVTSAWETQARGGTLPPEKSARNDAVLAMISLGYKQADAHKAVEKVDSEITNADEILRAALRLMQ